MDKIVITLRKEKKQSAKSVITGISYAQGRMADELSGLRDDPYDRLLSLHADELARMFLELSSKNQIQYTIKLTELQANAFCQMWGRVSLDYGTYGAVHLQQMIDAIHKATRNPILENLELSKGE